MQPSARMLPAAAAALFAGIVQAVRSNAFLLLTQYGFDVSLLAIAVPALGLVALAVSPFAVAAVGYLWGRGADVSRQWLPFVVGLFGAALVGFVGAYVVTAALALLGPGHGVLGELARKVATDLVFVLGLANVALAGLAGGAVAHFQTTKTRNSNTATP